MEKWDAYDEKLTIIPNLILIRGENIPEGVYHLVGEIIVQHQDGTYLITQRDYKKTNGGKWELSAGGSALLGESPLECAKRELKEETGMVEDNLIEVGRISQFENRSIYVVYLCLTNCQKDSIKLQKNETINYRWVSKKELFNNNSIDLISYRALRWLKENRI